MKTKNMLIVRSSVVMLLIFTIVGCKKFDDFGKMNIDPTKSSQTNPESQLIYTQLYFSGDLGIQERTNIIVLLPMMQQLGGASLNLMGAQYVKNSVERMSRLFEQGYPSDVVNIVDAVKRTNGVENKTNLNAMCRIMKVYTFARYTDLYGDIPYSEAGRAFHDGIIRPKYDTQEFIYDDFLKELKAASAQLDVTKDKVPNEVFYKGDIALWKKFANSLRLRLAMRLVKRDPERAKIEVQEAYAAGVFTSNADICMTRHVDNQNNYADIRGNSMSVAINQQTARIKIVSTFFDLLKNPNDPRYNHIVRAYKNNPVVGPGAPLFTREDITTQIKATTQGMVAVRPGRVLLSDDPVTNVTITLANGTSFSAGNNDVKVELNNAFIRNNAPFLHLSYAEVELLLADATVSLGLTLGPNAAAHYNKGVEAAINQISLFPGIPSIPSSEVTTFLTNNPLVPGSELKQINEQLYIALMLNGPEIYANWRRSGYPELIPTPTSESASKTIPRRFEYPPTEDDNNSTNVNAAISRIDGGVDDWTKRVWWDKE